MIIAKEIEMRRGKRKDPGAVRLGKLGGKIANRLRTPKERSEYARIAAMARWKNHEYSDSPGAVYARQQRAKKEKESAA